MRNINIKTFLTNLSHHPGVYQMLDEQGGILYVGKAKNLKKRITSYFSGRVKDLKTLSLVKYIHDINIIVTHSENEAVLLECNLIKQHRPRYNILLRDDKSYPYIVISHHGYPRIDLYRGQRKKNGRYFGPYPSSLAVRETISMIQKLFRIRTCTDNFFAARTRPCLLYQIERCTGPCVDLVNKIEYAQQIELAVKFLEGKNDEIIHALQNKMEIASQTLDFEGAAHYRDQIQRLRQIQERQYVNVAQGNADVIGYANQENNTCIQVLSIRHGQILGSQSYFPTVPQHSLANEVIAAFLTQHYLSSSSPLENIPKQIITHEKIVDQRLLQQVLIEQAQHQVELMQPIRGEKKKWLDMAMMSAKQSLATRLFTKINMRARMTALQTELVLDSMPRRIECFDISHSQGEATVASCVVFDQQGPVKSDYRRFNIENITPGDDPAAMQQVLLRRFKRLQKEASLPDIVLIDGGKPQLNAAITVMATLGIHDILLIGVAKGAGRKPGFETLHRPGQPVLHLSADSLALHLIQHIRDEAHRFAITGHRQRRDKTRQHSSLEFIPGIGAKRRRELLRYFGGIQGLAHASLEELVKVPGINRPLAERIFATFHDTTLHSDII
ncbi:MAG TPA: excinuclease ABC subunit UvrC [Gammaproteobacteria bacterium]|jgi:excinuclease ABC subunit C|nr:excinuclease ABC subunit UvrC [Gammaproteobacteria bacterium]